jgi:DNA-binding MarR family transcriptional regulator
MENGSGILTIPPGPQGTNLPHPAGHLLGTARILALAVQETVESKLQAEIAGDRLSPSQWKLLEIFATTEVGNVTEVAAYQGVSTAAASKAVDRLVRLGLLERAEDHEDRRHIRLSLSPEGSRMSSAYLARLEARLSELFSCLSADDLAHLSSQLDQLTTGVLRAASNATQICVQCGLNQREGCLMDEALHRQCLYHSVHRPSSKVAPVAARAHA